MSAALLALGIVASIAPYALGLERVAPVSAAALWLASLIARASLAITLLVGAAGLFYRSSIFHQLKELCVHFFGGAGDALGIALTGHLVIDLFIAVPALAATLCLAYRLRELLVARLQLAKWIATHAAGPGPAGSLVVKDGRSWLAVVGLLRGRVVVSDAALLSLDREELRAGLEHEAAHVRRGHKPVLLIASFCTALAALIPGTRRAERELSNCLERDADEAAVKRTRDPLALASAICKTALPAAAATQATALSGGPHTSDRIGDLMAGGRRRGSRLAEFACASFAVLSISVAAGVALTVPSLALAAAGTGITHGLSVCA